MFMHSVANITLNGSTTTEEPPDQAKFDAGHISFELVSCVLMWVLVPGCGFFYSGMGSSKNGVMMIIVSFWSIAIVSIQWYAIGYSLSFSQSATPFIGNFKNAFLMGVYDGTYGEAYKIPELVFCLYQGITANLAPSLILGVIAERGRILPAVCFILIWTTFAYDPIACWSLNSLGWSSRLGVLDFGGGAPVHVPSGAAALAYTLHLGPKLKSNDNPKPHNMITLVIGTTLIWFGSFGYNAGSAWAGDMVAIMAALSCNLSGSAGAITWVAIDYYTERNLSAFGFCAGAVVGLVCVTPGSGFINPGFAIIYGVLGAASSNFGLKFASRFPFEDTLDVVSMHGVSGVVGNLLTGIFASKVYGGHLIERGGWIDGHWMQMVYQITDTCAAFTWSFIVSYVSLYCMNKIPCLRLRVSPEVERYGLDESEVGVRCYEFFDGIDPRSFTGFPTMKPNGHGNGSANVPEINQNRQSPLPRPPNHENIMRNNWI